ncbi:hypothetical protein F0365_14295 [Nonlabens sp. Ci31]|uniref:DUF7677 family protein n=1 Tax=Nonlabens sp. Ci31 TaxID=2608253 RepID=UPI001462FDD1|nr:hypothetical protein [Nonlabens sp. Ci31]QJP35484.1 hypothetical protein F0365_14295 [Nonlabens sp. Ci31]
MELSTDFKRALRLFVYYYTNGTLAYLVTDGHLLAEADYMAKLADQPSNMEQVFAIYTNNIKMDENGKVLNQKHAINRAAQYIITVCNENAENAENYKVIPEFEPWEMELH